MVKNNLDDIVYALASELKKCIGGAKANKLKIKELASIIDNTSIRKEKSKYKSLLLDKIGFEVNKYPTSKISTISKSILYLKKLGVKNIGKVARKLPQILAYTTKSMQERADFLSKIGIKDLGKVIEKSPAILEYKTESMQERVNFLKELGVKDIGKVVGRLPQILEYKTESMQERVNYLKGLKVKNIGKVIEKSPAVLEYKTESMQERVNFLKELGVKNIGKVIERLPQILEYSIESMQERADFLSKIGIKDLGKVVGKLPAVLELTTEGMQEKLDYFRKQEYSINEIENFPISLGCSFKKRIMPRFEYLKLKKPNEKYSLSRILCTRDKVFAKTAGSTPDEYEEFKKSFDATA